MIKIPDIEKSTGLKKNFIGRCVRAMPEIFDSRKKSDKNNCGLYDPSVYHIFDVIKQDKEKGLSIPEIKRRLLEIYPQDEKPIEPPCNTTCTTLKNPNDEKPDYSAIYKDKAAVQLVERLHQSEIAKIKAEKDREIDQMKNRLEQIEGMVKLLPASGDIEKAHRMRDIITKLEEKTKTKGVTGFLFGDKEINQLWKDLKEIL